MFLHNQEAHTYEMKTNSKTKMFTEQIEKKKEISETNLKMAISRKEVIYLIFFFLLVLVH